MIQDNSYTEYCTQDTLLNIVKCPGIPGHFTLAGIYSTSNMMHTMRIMRCDMIVHIMMCVIMYTMMHIHAGFLHKSPRTDNQTKN